MAIVKDIDKGFKALMRRMGKAARGRSLSVGIHDEAGAASAGSATLADVAAIHEFGLGSAPARSFVGAWADEKATENERVLAKAAEAVIKGAGLEAELNRVGLYFVGTMQARIQGGLAPPLDPATVARKGSSTPLIDTGQLISSITHEVK